MTSLHGLSSAPSALCSLPRVRGPLYLHHLRASRVSDLLTGGGCCGGPNLESKIVSIIAEGPRPVRWASRWRRSACRRDTAMIKRAFSRLLIKRRSPFGAVSVASRYHVLCLKLAPVREPLIRYNIDPLGGYARPVGGLTLVREPLINGNRDCGGTN
jgi:hypothetical protein